MGREGPINLEKVPCCVFWGREEMEADVPHPPAMLVTGSSSLGWRGGREVALWLFHGWQMCHVQAELLPWGLELSSSTSCAVPLVRGVSEGRGCSRPSLALLYPSGDWMGREQG